MNIVSIFLLSLFILNSSYAQDQYQQQNIDCVKVVSELDTVMNVETSLKSLEEIQNFDPDLVVIGEFHYDHLFWKMPHVYSYFKSLLPRVNCLYSEISQDGTEQEILEMISGLQNDLFYTVRRLGFGPLYQSIYAQGDNVVLVDAPRTDNGFRPEDTSSSWLTRRDSFMISRIDTAIRTQECSAGIYNVGAQHIWDSLGIEEEPYESFGTRVKESIHTVIIDKAQTQELQQCEWQGVRSFIAPATNPQVRKFFNLDASKSSADYVLYLRSIDIMHALTQPNQAI